MWAYGQIVSESHVTDKGRGVTAFALEFYWKSANLLFYFFLLSCPQNLNQNPRTLLPKFYGLYCVQAGGKNIRIVVMNNLLPRSVKMHIKYDLKGSTYKRRASQKEREKPLPTLKDLDFLQDIPDGLFLDADMYNALCKTLQRDCLVSLSHFLLSQAPEISVCKTAWSFLGI